MHSSASPRPAPSSAWHFGTISVAGSTSPGSASFRLCQASSDVAASQPDSGPCPGFCPCYLNGLVEVDGDIAQARWYLFMPCTVAAGNQAMWRAGIDHETYARVDGVWMFRHKRSEPLMNVPFETGWAETRFA